MKARGQMEGLMEWQEWQWLLQQRLRLVLELWQHRLCQLLVQRLCMLGLGMQLALRWRHLHL